MLPRLARRRSQTGPPAGPPAEPAGLDRSLLPRPTTTRYLLLVLIVAASGMFAARWVLVLRRNSWPQPNLRCVAGLAAGGPAGAAVRTFNRCLDAIRVEQQLVALAGPVVLGLLAIAGCALTPLLQRAWFRTRPVDEAVRPVVAAALAEAMVGSRLRRSPQVLVAHRRLRLDGLSFGWAGRYWIAVGARLLPERDGLRAVLSHEVGHLRNRDVARTYLALWSGVAFAVVVVGPLVVDAVRYGVAGALGWRLAVLVATVFFGLAAVVRVREYDADLAAAAAGFGPVLLTALAAIPGRAGQGRTRQGRAGWRPGRLHPSRQARHAVLQHPELIMKLGSAEAFFTGLAGAIVFSQLALLAEGLLPHRVLLAYWLAGALTGVLVGGVVGVAGWRAVLAAREYGRPPPTGWLPGLALGAGFVAGSQLFLGSAGTWYRVIATAPDRAADLSLLTARPAVALVMVALAGALGVVLVRWMITAAGGWLAEPRHRPPPRSLWPACLGLAVGTGLVAAVPMGSWGLALRLAADGDRATQLVATMGGGQLAAGLVVAATVGLGYLIIGYLVAGARHRAGPAGPHRLSWWGWRTAVAATVLISAVALARMNAGAVPAALPPPPVSNAASPLQGLLACRWLVQATEQGSVAGPMEPMDLQRLAGLLNATDDTPLRTIGRALADGEPQQAGLAFASRCDLLSRYGRFTTTTR